MLREKDYISWSQFSLWTSSKREYYKKYGLGEDRSQNKFFAKGKEFSDAQEYGDDGTFSTDEMLSFVLEHAPKLDLSEEKLMIELKNGEKILSVIDSLCSKGEEFLEYKTGKVAWTQEKVDSHGQMLFYALALYIKSGRLSVPSSRLIWIETEETEEGLKYTGLIEEFPREFTIPEIEAFEDEIIKVIDEIEAFEYLELEVEDEVMDRYIELDIFIKEAQAEMDVIKLGIQTEMEIMGLNYANSTNGKFSFSERKSWVYSEELRTTKEQIKKEIDKAEKLEQKDKIAIQTVSRSLRFSLNKQK